MDEAQSTLKEIYQLTLRLENSFREINHTLRQIMTKTMISDRDKPHKKHREEGQRRDSKQVPTKSKKSKTNVTADSFHSRDRSQMEGIVEVQQANFCPKKDQRSKQRVENVQIEGGISSNANQRAHNPFHIFYIQQRLQLLRDRPNLNPSQMGRIIQKRWRRLPEEQKRVYFEAESLKADQLPGYQKCTTHETEVEII